MTSRRFFELVNITYTLKKLILLLKKFTLGFNSYIRKLDLWKDYPVKLILLKFIIQKLLLHVLK